MPAERLSMRKIQEVLRLHAAGHSQPGRRFPGPRHHRTMADGGDGLREAGADAQFRPVFCEG